LTGSYCEASLFGRASAAWLIDPMADADANTENFFNEVFANNIRVPYYE
jgi:hypothetical protein